MTTEEEVITAILMRPCAEVGARRRPTKFGVTADALGEYRRLGRAATAAEVQALTESEAREIARVRFVERPGFHQVAYGPLRAQLVDFGFYAGPALAIGWLQRVLGFETQHVSGQMDWRTFDALARCDTDPLYQRLLNDALVAARLFTQDAGSLEFLLSRPSA